MFARHCDGQQDRSTTTAAVRAWVEAIGELGNYYHDQFVDGNRDVVQFLVLEEANLLHAGHIARRHGWRNPVISAMQGLQSLYQYQGRLSEWSRLVAQITPDYCNPDDGPILGREDRCYTCVMHYRVTLAQRHDRNLFRAAALQEKVVAWDRRRAAPALDLPPDADLDSDQYDSIRALAMSIGTFGQILEEQGNPACVPAYEEAIRHVKRIQYIPGEAIGTFNLGHAYLTIPAIRNLGSVKILP